MDGDVHLSIQQAREALGLEQYSRARDYFDQAVEQAREAHLEPELAYALRHGAIASLECSEAESALRDAEEAAAIYDKLEPARGLNFANSVRLVALAKEGLERESEARDDWLIARDIYAGEGIKEGVIECDAHLA